MQQTSTPKIPFTQAAYQKLREKLAKLIKERKEVMQRLITAREMGDLSENGAYKYAKFELGNIGRQLRDIRHQLDTGEVVEVKDHYDQVTFGCTVTVKSKDTNAKTTYFIVGKYETNPLERRISLDSPLGSALAGKKTGEVVSVKTPKGMAAYEIVQIQ